MHVSVLRNLIWTVFVLVLALPVGFCNPPDKAKSEEAADKYSPKYAGPLLARTPENSTDTNATDTTRSCQLGQSQIRRRFSPADLTPEIFRQILLYCPEEDIKRVLESLSQRRADALINRPRIQADTHIPFHWVENPETMSYSAPLVRDEIDISIRCFQDFFRGGFFRVHDVLLPIRRTQKCYLFDKPSGESPSDDGYGSQEVNLSDDSCDDHVDDIVDEEETPPTASSAVLELEWKSNVAFLSWFPPGRDGINYIDPADTPVALDQDVSVTSLTEWFRENIQAPKSKMGGVSHSWGYFSFNYTIKILEPESTSNKPFQLNPPEADPGKPFYWRVVSDYSKEGWITREMKQWLIQRIDEFFKDGYPPRTRRDSVLVIPSPPSEAVYRWNVPPGAPLPITITLVFDYVGNPSVMKPWWNLGGGVVTPYDTPVAAQRSEPMDTSLRTWLRQRILHGDCNGLYVKHSWGSFAFLMNMYVL